MFPCPFPSPFLLPVIHLLFLPLFCLLLSTTSSLLPFLIITRNHIFFPSFTINKQVHFSPGWKIIFIHPSVSGKKITSFLLIPHLINYFFPLFHHRLNHLFPLSFTFTNHRSIFLHPAMKSEEGEWSLLLLLLTYTHLWASVLGLRLTFFSLGTARWLAFLCDTPHHLPLTAAAMLLGHQGPCDPHLSGCVCVCVVIFSGFFLFLFYVKVFFQSLWNVKLLHLCMVVFFFINLCVVLFLFFYVYICFLVT